MRKETNDICNLEVKVNCLESIYAVTPLLHVWRTQKNVSNLTQLNAIDLAKSTPKLMLQVAITADIACT